MRLLVAIAALTLPLGTATAQRSWQVPANPGAPPMRICQNPMVHHAEGDRKGEFNRLGDLPPGDLLLSVMRGSDGCFKPVIVREGIGTGAPRDASPPPPRFETPRRPKLIR